MVISLFEKFKSIPALGLAFFLCIGAMHGQRTISCVGSFNLSMPDCEVGTIITPNMVVAGSLDTAVAEYNIIVRDKHDNILPEDKVTGHHIGQTITYSLIQGPEASGQNSCWGSIFVEDKIAPIFPSCSSTQMMTTVECFSMDEFTIPVEDNCDPSPELILVDEIPVETACNQMDNTIKKLLRKYVAIDASGNVSDTCEFVLSVTKLDIEPSNPQIEGPRDTVLQCNTFELDFQGHPDPIMAGVPIFLTGGDTVFLFPDSSIAVCKLSVVYNDEVILDTDCTKKYIRSWTLIEGCLNSPEQRTFVQQITVMDSIAPTLEPTADIELLTNGDGQCIAVEAIPVPDFSDNCIDKEDLSLFYKVNFREPRILFTGQPIRFEEGMNTLEFILFDGCIGNNSSVVNETRDTVKIWVEDKTPPVCIAESKSAVSLNNDTGEVVINASVLDEGSKDNCSNKVKVFAKRDTEGCNCLEEDAERRYSDFIYLGRRGEHDYYLSEDEVVAPKAFQIANAMGGYVVTYNSQRELNFVRRVVRNYGLNIANPPLANIPFTVGYSDVWVEGEFEWESDSDFMLDFMNINNIENDYVMGTSVNALHNTYNGREDAKRFVLEVDTPCGFSETIRLCCVDVFEGAPVTLRVMDKWGNFTECSDTVLVQDKTPPRIACPRNMEISCVVDITDLSQFGMPTAEDACEAQIREIAPVRRIDAKCGIGTITRRFIIRDGNGEQRCNQVIRVTNDAIRESLEVIDPLSIYIPDSLPALGIVDMNGMCDFDIDRLHPDSLPARFSPQFTDNGICTNLWVGFEDDRFVVPNASVGSCFKIVRKWLILDECFFDTITGSIKVDTVYEYDQSIVITNSIKPTITLTANTEMMACNIDGNCEKGSITLGANFSDDCTSPADLIWSYAIDLNFDMPGDTVDINVSGIGPRVLLSGMASMYPIGKHKITFFVQDRCANTQALVHEFEIKICEEPTAVCQSLTQPLHLFPDPPRSPDVDGNVLMDSVYMCSQADWFQPTKGGGSYHPCDVPLVYSFSRDTTDTERCFTCADLCAPREVTIFVTDTFGNVDSCISTMTLTDPKGLCPPITVTNAGPDQQICSDAPTVNLNGTIGGGAVSATWVGGNGTFAPSRNVLNPTYTPTGPEIAAGSVTLTLSPRGAAPNCDADDSVVIMISQAIVAVAGPDQTLCEGTVAVINGSPAGGTWTTSGNGTFNPAMNRYTPGSQDINSGSVTLTYTTANPPGPCGPDSDALILRILPDPTVTPPAGGNMSFCEGQTVNQIALTGSTGARFNWTNSNTAIGLAASGRGNIPSFTAVNNGNADIVSTITVTPFSVGPNGNNNNGNGDDCVGDPIQFTITVSPGVTVDAGENINICSDDATVQLAGAISGITTAGSWIGGQGTFNPNRNSPTATYTFSPGEINAGSITLTLRSANPPGPCPSVDDQVTINISMVTVNAGQDITTCGDDSTVTLAGVISGSTTNGRWVGGAGTFSPSRNVPNAMYTPTQAEINAGAVTLTLRSGAIGACPAMDDQVIININQAVSVNAGADITVCADDAQVTLAGVISGLVTTGRWVDGEGTFDPNRTTLNATYTPTQGEIIAGTVTLILRSDDPAGPCPSTDDAVTIIISEGVDVNAGEDQTVCEDVSTVSLAGSVTGQVMIGRWEGGQGVYTPGRNSLNVTYTPTQAEKNAGSVTLTLRNRGNISPCTVVRDMVTINFTPNAVVSAGADQFICHNETATFTPTPAGGTFAGGMGSFNGNVYTPAPTERGATITLVYTVQGGGNGGCMGGSDEVELTISPTPTVNPIGDIMVCAGDPVVVGNFTGSAGTTFTWTNSAPSIGIPANGNGNISTFTAMNNSASDITATITVTPYNFGEDGVDNLGAGDDCVGAPITFTITVGTSGQGPLFECKKLVQNIEDTNPPSTTFNIFDIVCFGESSCSGQPTITAAFSADPLDTLRTYGCTNVGDIQLTLFVFDIGDADNDGVRDTTFREACFAIQTVLDPSGFCRNFAPGNPNIAGRIFTEDGDGIESTSVALIGDDSEEYTTDDNGLYAFPEMIMGNQYIVKPQKFDNPLNGLSTLDIILMQKHILGLAELDSPYKVIAADVNDSGTLSALDLIEMRKLLLAYYDEFPNVPSWKMVDASYQFLDPFNPLTEKYPQEYMIQELNKNMAINFIGIKMGDVNMSSDPNMLRRAEIRTSADVLTLDVTPRIIGDELRYDFTAQDFIDIEGFQFTLEVESAGLTFNRVEGSVLDMSEDNLGLRFINSGQITVSYDKVGGVSAGDDELLFSVVFKHTGARSYTFDLGSRILPAQAYSTQEVFDIDARLIETHQDIRLYQNKPNPWSESTLISFSLPQAMDFEMRFYSVDGSLLMNRKAEGHSGMNELRVMRDDLDTKGLVYYELITATEKSSKRMILIK